MKFFFLFMMFLVTVFGCEEKSVVVKKKEYLDKITHISTGGGAMLEFIENGNLPGLEALKKAKS